MHCIKQKPFIRWYRRLDLAKVNEWKFFVTNKKKESQGDGSVRDINKTNRQRMYLNISNVKELAA